MKNETNHNSVHDMFNEKIEINKNYEVHKRLHPKSDIINNKEIEIDKLNKAI